MLQAQKAELKAELNAELKAEAALGDKLAGVTFEKMRGRGAFKSTSQHMYWRSNKRKRSDTLQAHNLKLLIRELRVTALIFKDIYSCFVERPGHG